MCRCMVLILPVTVSEGSGWSRIGAPGRRPVPRAGGNRWEGAGSGGDRSAEADLGGSLASGKARPRSPVAIRPGRATVSAVRPSFPSRGPAAGRKLAARIATMPAWPSSSRPVAAAGPASGEASRDMRDRPGSAVPWLARIFDTNLPASGASPLSHARQPQLQIVTSARLAAGKAERRGLAGRHQALPARGSAPIAAFRRECPRRAVRWSSRSGS